MGATTGYYPISSSTVEKMRQDQAFCLSIIEHGWENVIEGFYGMDKWAIPLAMLLDPPRFGMPDDMEPIEAHAICDILLGDGGEVLHEELDRTSRPVRLITQELIDAALREFDHLDQQQVKRRYERGILVEMGYSEEWGNDESLFRTCLWFELMELKEVLFDTREAGELLLMLISV